MSDFKAQIKFDFRSGSAPDATGGVHSAVRPHLYWRGRLL